MSRRALAVGILAVWLGLMGWLGWREYRPRLASDVVAEAALSLPPGATITPSCWAVSRSVTPQTRWTRCRTASGWKTA